MNERRFALGVQLIDLRRDPLEVTEGYARVAEGALLALAEAATAEFEKAHGRFAGERACSSSALAGWAATR